MRRGERGFTYVGLMFTIAVLGILLAAVGVLWSTQVRREKEAQLLWVGDQYRLAITRYRAAVGTFPQSLQDLVEDHHTPKVRRYIRQLYPDPMTGQGDWQLLLGAGGGILGVASASQDKPIKVANFPPLYQEFEQAGSYADWKFEFSARPVRNRRLNRPAGTS